MIAVVTDNDDDATNTPNPTVGMLPWTRAPSFAPGSRVPTPSPTALHNNQDLLDLLASDTGSSTGSSLTQSNVTNGTNLTTLAPGNSSSIIAVSVDETSTTSSNTSMVPVVVNATDVSGNSSTTDNPSNASSSFIPFTTPPSPAPTNATIMTPTSSPSPTTTLLSPAPSSSVPSVTAVPSSAPSWQPTGQPDVVFPEYTLTAFNNPGSPQSKAFSWMLRDPNFGLYLPNRIRQRFALATLYYATNGDDWTVQQQPNDNPQARQAAGDTTNGKLSGHGGLLPWLSYAGHECDWYFSKELLLESPRASLSGVQELCQEEIVGDTPFRSYRSLWLEGTQLQGTLPPELALLTGLENVQLSHNDLFGTLPAAWFWDDKATTITWQTSLKELHLKNNSFTGQIPSEIGLASHLVTLDLQQNQFRENIPTEIGWLTNLQHLLWNDNVLTGPIPSEIGVMRNLTAVSWNANQLTGSIPGEIMRCQSLQEFYVGENRLSGSIPWQFGVLRDTLLDLHLYGNQFTHDIPTRMGLLTNLRWLHLGNNQITGEVPTELGKMTQLQLLQLENNALQGSFPSESLASLDKVSRVWLHGNPELNGTTPLSWCGGAFSDRVVDIKVDCNDQVQCVCRQGCACV